MATLRYLDDTGRIQSRLLDTEHFIIGRANTCQLVVDSDMISREHVRIDLEKDGRFRIRDLGSRNRTFVNGELITETLLTAGDIVRAGDWVAEFVDDGMVAERVELDVLTPDRTEPPHCEWVKIKVPVSLTLAQIEQLSQLAADQPLTARVEDVAHAAIGQIVLDLQAERGMIALRGDKKTDLRPIAHRALAKAPGGTRIPISQSFAMAPMLQGVAGRYPQTAGQLDPKLGYAITAMVAPLTFRGETIGMLYVDRPVAKKPFASPALQYLLAAGAHAGGMLGEVVRKLARYAPREGLAWLTNLRRIQTSLRLPLPESDTFDIANQQFPGRARCGDLFAVMHLDEHRCGIIVVDGGGHGITGLAQANALVAAARAAVAVSEDVLTDPAGLFSSLNQSMAISTARQVLPCTFVGIDTAAGKLSYINAGGRAPLLMIAPGRLLTLDQSALVLGVDADYQYETTRVDLPQAFRLICCTDGLLEGAGAGGEPLGDQRLHEALLDRDAFATAGDVVARIIKTWQAHLGGSQTDDDVLILVVAHNG